MTTDTGELTRRGMNDLASPMDENGLQLLSDQPIQRMQTSYATAMSVQRPRDLAVIEKAALQEAALLGADAFYAWGAGKDRVEGPSVDLANCLVRCWGNCALEMQPVQETPTGWIFTAAFIDLETGYTLMRQFRQAKDWTVYGKFDEARKEDIRFQIGQSKALRNVVLNAMPAWLVRRAMDKAKGGVREKMTAAIDKHGIERVAKQAMDKLENLGVNENRVLKSMGRKSVAALTVEDLVLLHGNAAALESGSDDIDGVFPVPDETKSKRGAEGLTDRLIGGKKGEDKPAGGSDEEPAETTES